MSEDRGIWNYRIVKKAGPEGVGYYLHEVCYNNSGEICAMAQEPSFPFGETLEELLHDLENMLKDAKNQPVLKHDKIIFASMDG
ncbi:MAG: hypothetical protein PHT15_06305 [Gallionellaceae bacterium]|nr:hypothetical protein [Gallionellaceae bacterium]